MWCCWGPAVAAAVGTRAAAAAPAERVGDSAEGRAVVLGVRPEHIYRADSGAPASGTVRFEAPIEILPPTGSRTYATFRMGGIPVMAELDAHDASKPGEAVTLELNLNRAALFDAETQQAL